jgi:hypothetical protein
MAEEREDLVDVIEPGAAPDPEPRAAIGSPDPAPANSAPSPAEPDPLDALLAEFDREAGSRPAPEQPQPQQQADPLRAPSQGHEYQQRAEQAERALAEANHREFWREHHEAATRLEEEAQRKLAEAFEDVPEDFAKDQIALAAIRDPALLNAWFQQGQNPVAWKVAHKQLMRELHKKLESRPDREVTEDIAAVTHAVRSAGGPVAAEPPPDLSRMTENEFRQYRSQFGF